MSIAVANYDDEDKHRREPPMKKERSSCGSRHGTSPCHESCRDRTCDERPEECEREKHGRETRRRYLFRDLPIPTRADNLNSTRAEKMMRIKSPGDLMCVPIPNSRRKQRNRREESQPL